MSVVLGRLRSSGYMKTRVEEGPFVSTKCDKHRVGFL